MRSVSHQLKFIAVPKQIYTANTHTPTYTYTHRVYSPNGNLLCIRLRFAPPLRPAYGTAGSSFAYCLRSHTAVWPFTICLQYIRIMILILNSIYTYIHTYLHTMYPMYFLCINCFKFFFVVARIKFSLYSVLMCYSLIKSMKMGCQFFFVGVCIMNTYAN